MTDLTTEHRGFRIRYGENSDEWGCAALDVYAPTLSALKRKIDAIERKTRQTESIPVFVIGYRGGIEPATITAKISKSVRGSRYWDSREGVWCVDANTGHRRKVDLAECVEDTPENRARIAEYERLCAVAKANEKAANNFRATLPRMSMDAVAPADPEVD